MDPDAIEREERPPGRPGPHRGRLPEVLSELTERARQGKPLVDISKDDGEAARVLDNSLGEGLHLESPLPWGKPKMGRDNMDHAAVDRDVDLKGAPGLTRWDV